MRHSYACRIGMLLLTVTLVCGPSSLFGAGPGRASGAEARSYDRELLAAINQYRDEQGLGRLRLHAGLTGLARAHSADMARRHRLGHQGFEDRFQASGRRSCVENVGWNYASPQAQFEGWRRSAGHDRNMLQPRIRWAGLAEEDGYVTFFACW